MSALGASLLERIQTRTARTGVVGLGYVGLPLAVELSKAGFHTTGIDLDERKIQAIAQGRSYIPDVSTSDVMELRRAGKLERGAHPSSPRNAATQTRQATARETQPALMVDWLGRAWRAASSVGA